MKKLDFPNSATAVRRHGREYHDQDFLDTSCPPDGAGSVPEPQRHGERLGRLALWTLACVMAALAAAFVMTWLVQPDTPRARWVENSAVPAASFTRQGRMPGTAVVPQREALTSRASRS